MKRLVKATFLMILMSCTHTTPQGISSSQEENRSEAEDLSSLLEDSRVIAARHRHSVYIEHADRAITAMQVSDMEETAAEYRTSARLWLLTAIVEQERHAIEPEVVANATIEVDVQGQIEAARVDVHTDVQQTFVEAQRDEERRLRRTVRERAATRVQAMSLIENELQEALRNGAGRLDSEMINAYQLRFNEVRAITDMDEKYLALDELLIDVREALRRQTQ